MTKKKQTLYEILGVSRHATEQTIRKAYKKLARAGAHPDKGGTDDQFRRIKDAMDLLTDPHKRRAYDHEMRWHFQQQDAEERRERRLREEQERRDQELRREAEKQRRLKEEADKQRQWREQQVIERRREEERQQAQQRLKEEQERQRLKEEQERIQKEQQERIQKQQEREQQRQLRQRQKQQAQPIRQPQQQQPHQQPHQRILRERQQHQQQQQQQQSQEQISFQISLSTTKSKSKPLPTKNMTREQRKKFFATKAARSKGNNAVAGESVSMEVEPLPSWEYNFRQHFLAKEKYIMEQEYEQSRQCMQKMAHIAKYDKQKIRQEEENLQKQFMQRWNDEFEAREERYFKMYQRQHMLETCTDCKSGGHFCAKHFPKVEKDIRG